MRRSLPNPVALTRTTVLMLLLALVGVVLGQGVCQGRCGSMTAAIATPGMPVGCGMAGMQPRHTQLAGHATGTSCMTGLEAVREVPSDHSSPILLPAGDGVLAGAPVLHPVGGLNLAASPLVRGRRFAIRV